MDYFNIGGEISMKDYNSLVYLLRKFKRLNTGLRLGNLTLETDYGFFVFDKSLTSVGSNFILEQEINVSGSDCLKNCFYSFIFTAIDVNTSGIVNKRQVKVTGATGENGTLLITLPTDLIDSDEVLLPYFDLDIVFDEHEYYTPVVDAVNVDLVSDKTYVLEGETATITATLTDRDDEPLTSVPCTFIVNGESYPTTTDENGQAEYTYTSTGEYSKIDIKVITTTLTIYDTPLTANVMGNYIRFIGNDNNWLKTDGDCVIDWGDGTTTTVNNPTSTLIHDYTDSEQTHTIVFLGIVTGLGDLLFANSGLMSINIPHTVTSFGRYCFSNCDIIKSIIIPSTVTSIGDNCFKGCYYLVDYQLYWIGDAIIPYDSNKMPNNENSVFSIPNIQTSNYVARGYPSAKLSERSGIITILTLESSKSSYYTDESITLTGLLVDENNNPLTSKSVKIYQNNALLDTVTTDSTGGFTKTLSSLNIGTYTFKAQYDEDTTYEGSTSTDCSITIQNHTYSLSITPDKQTIYTGESVTLSGVLLKDGAAFDGQSIQIIISGVVVIDTVTTDSNGAYSKTIEGLTPGTYMFKARNSNVESSTIYVTVKEHDYALSVASTKDILSYEDRESATLTASLTDDGVAVSGETLSYVIKHETTIITTGSDTTDSNGEISITYVGTGVGNVTVEVNFGILVQTYELEDCKFYDPMTSASGHWANSDSTKQTISYSSDGATITSSTADALFYEIDIPYNAPFSVECTLKSTDNHLCIRGDKKMINNPVSTRYFHAGRISNGWEYKVRSTNTTATGSFSTPTLTDGDVMKIVDDGTNMKWYINDTLISTVNESMTGIPLYLGFVSIVARTITVKDFKVKAL